MGGIDEAALDKLSLVTEMTKHIQVRASSSSQAASASEIGQFSPLFLWLLRVRYLSSSILGFLDLMDNSQSAMALNENTSLDCRKMHCCVYIVVVVFGS